jgi:hypothetical protein
MHECLTYIGILATAEVLSPLLQMLMLDTSPACLPVCACLPGQFLRSLDVPARWCETTAMAAAKGGQLACLAWLKAHGCPLDVAACIDAASKHDHAEVLQFLLTECMW